MAHFHDNALIGASGQGGYQIERSLRFNSADSAYLNRTPASAGNRKTWTWSGWVKRSSLTTGQWLFGAGPVSTDYTIIRFGSGGSANDFLEYVRVVGSAINAQKISSAVYRDTSAWYHIVVTEDAANTVARVYVNGSEISYSTNVNPSNVDGAVNNTGSHEIGRYVGSAIQHFSGYLTEINFIDGQALTPSSFGETDTITGVWKPKRYSGTYGTNGFYLKFADNSGTTSTTLGKDSSGNGNNWTPNNFSVTAGAGNDSLIDTPTPYADGGNGRGNYATLNPLFNTGILGYFWLTNGNLTAVEQSGSAAWRTRWSTIGITSGKFYAEFTISYSGSASIVSGNGAGVGLYDGGTATYVGETSTSYGYLVNGQKYNNNSGVSYGATYTNGDVIGVAYDADAGTLTFYKNGVSQGVAYSSIPSRTYFFAASAYWVYPDGVTNIHANFGQRPFAYTPPSGFLALNTQNLPEPSIKKPSSYMDVVLYTGNGSARSITGLGFSPDLVWIKERSGADNHRLVDAVRGATKELYSSLTNAEGTDANGLTAFNSDGFSLGTSNSYNENGVTHVAWCWDKSATPGFDIVTYTGNGSARTIAHSLGVAPQFIIVKNRSNGTANWQTGSAYHNATSPWNYYMRLNTTAAAVAASTIWNNTAPTSSVFSVGTDGEVNANGDNYVAYLWSEVAGFSKFGSYTGNGVADGPFVFCNFRPRWVLIKSSTVATSWYLFDAARGTINVNSTVLYPNVSAIEDTNFGQGLDFTSNGFKVRAPTGYGLNNSGATYIFMAFAESPAKYALAR